MLIRPTLLKDFQHRVWQDVWRAAGRALAGATRWLIVGYSLPLADVWMLRLLAQSVRSGRTGRERSIALVNPDPEVLKRFGLLFPVRRVGRYFDACIDRCRDEDRLVWEAESNGGGTLAG